MFSPDRRYAAEFALALAGYAGLLVVAGFIVDANRDAGWRYVIAIAPMLPAAFMVLAWVRYFRRVDELQQRIALESLAFAFGGTALITFGYGFLDEAGLPRPSWFWIWPIMAALWILGGQLAKRRWL